MSIFRILSIICSVVLVTLLVISVTVELSTGLTWAIVIVGILTAVFNVISTIMWWITDAANSSNAQQLRWSRMSYR